jgi:hypothetical protein
LGGGGHLKISIALVLGHRDTGVKRSAIGFQLSDKEIIEK